MFAPSPRRPVLIVHRRSRYRRLVRCARVMRITLGYPEWYVAARLGMKRDRVRLALTEGAGIWSPSEWQRMCAAYAAEAAR